MPWLDVSQDPIVGTNQKTEHLYEKVCGKYLEICKAYKGTKVYKVTRMPTTGVESWWYFGNRVSNDRCENE